MHSDLLLTRPVLPPLLLSESSEAFPLLPFILPHSFSSERHGIGSVDWPPTGSTLVPEGGNVGQGDGIGIQVRRNPYIFVDRSFT
jgi:hypothetical protein